jgi:uncharacterized protein HemX
VAAEADGPERPTTSRLPPDATVTGTHGKSARRSREQSGQSVGRLLLIGLLVVALGATVAVPSVVTAQEDQRSIASLVEQVKSEANQLEAAQAVADNPTPLRLGGVALGLAFGVTAGAIGRFATRGD